ncbi:MAG: LytR C-terminal domain-containing protein [Actinomycetota bacterium]
MTSLEQDEFDRLSGIGGKHLAPKRPLDYLISFLTLMVLSAGVAYGALVGLKAWDATLIFSEPIEDDAVVEPTVPQDEVAIVDGTNTNLAIQLSDSLKAEGWNVISEVSLKELDPNLGDSPTTLIFISEEIYRTSAEALLSRFPDTPIEVSSQFNDPITVLIGRDYLN